MKDQVKQIHFVGIGGVGMAGIAEVCLNLGYIVSGSDIKCNATVERLQSLGARIQIGHSAEHVKNSDVVVVSTAIAPNNPEVSWARDARIPVIPRAEMLAELMRMRFGIAIAGTHGKTTTTSLTAAVLTQGGVDPTFVIGGKLNQVGSNARLGSSHYLVAEADESDASFLHLSPMMSVVTNIDEDHMDTYQGDYHNLENTFIEFIHRLPFYGLAILCADDENIRNIVPKLTRKILTYGFSEEADVRATNVKSEGLQMSFDVCLDGIDCFPVRLNTPGEHNVLNSLAAIAVGLQLDVSIEAIQQGLLEFGGVGRRFEVYPQRCIKGKNVTLVDDYGHHPTELTATLTTARNAFPEQRLVLVFQPHRYTRTRDLFDDFVQALLLADLVILTEVYAAGEAHLPKFDSKALLKALRLRGGQGFYAEDFDQLETLAGDLLEDNDLVLVMGAGDIGQVSKAWQSQQEV
ncbi:UDP-N-acetylmuramate--L-alanine ligase [Thiomicrorhabdus heinhorstiae]|uniref:UDP-N-acetylmuramate--L-alanine ligase n=1 Tax=Thiomicrorhabdus heinhorstiae TaxID=2748010 RepID=A0ABS0BXQ7_9GAMM|nr:UDP-N-acetylmuramate--L-alanine ligase [Thiomicrorhabdus heinhorstiae]MBF6058578.1 UDP-N-acetylmuramate--L-alanine ligase [Thiomicrorhabdus heinhorstiae]